VGRPVDMLLSDQTRQALLAQRSHTSAVAGELDRALSFPETTVSVLTVPLFMRGELNALLVVASPEKLPKSTGLIPWIPTLPKRGRISRRWGVVVNGEA